MTLRSDRQIFADRCRQFYDRAFPKGAKIKSLQHILGLSFDAAEKLAAGRVPTTNHLLLLARHFGREFVDQVFAEVVERHSLASAIDLDAVRRSLNAQALESSLPALRAATSQDSNHLSGASRDRCLDPRPGPNVAFRRLSLANIERANSHLAFHFRRWSESLKLSDRQSLIAVARAMPEVRTSVQTLQNEDLVYDYVSPAFRLYGRSHESMVGRSTVEAAFDRSYSEACGVETRRAIALGEAVAEEVHATANVEPGVFMQLSYRRLILPYVEAQTRFAVVTSEIIATPE